MPKYVAFLRAINVGGHTVKMDYLRGLFAALGFTNVETFIASGNVVFQTKSKDASALERKIEDKLKASLGYDVATFIRTEAELAAVANCEAFPPTAVAAASAFNVGFLEGRVDDERRQKLLSLCTEIDQFHVRERELLWLSKTKVSESKLNYKTFEKTLGMKATFRGLNTVKRMTAKYPPR